MLLFVRVVYGTLTLIAIYLSFRRNAKFAFGPFLAAVFAPIIYIIYSIAVPVNGVHLFGG